MSLNSDRTLNFKIIATRYFSFFLSDFYIGVVENTALSSSSYFMICLWGNKRTIFLIEKSAYKENFTYRLINSTNKIIKSE